MSTSSSAEPGADPATAFHPDLFRDRSVLVTGGTSGIGGAIALAFARAGAAVTATGGFAAEIAATDGRPEWNAVNRALLDVRDADAITGLVGGLARLDIVVNCAGVIRRNAEQDPSVFAEVLDINLNGTMRICAAARPLLARSAAGAIVNTASMLSFFGAGLAPAYAASKGGVAQLTKSLAIAYAADGIRVNAIAPGWIETNLTAPLRRDEQRYATIRERTALRRWGQPDELVGAVFFLCSHAAAYVTGAILPVDGGYLAM